MLLHESTSTIRKLKAGNVYKISADLFWTVLDLFRNYLMAPFVPRECMENIYVIRGQYTYLKKQTK